MNKYRRVIKAKEEVVKDDTEVRVTSTGGVSTYVSRAVKVFNELEKTYITITASGNALTKAVTAAEVIKRRLKGLHQITTLTNQDVVDEFEPLEEGLEKVTETRSLACIAIKLSKDPLDTADIGYQAPLDESLVKEVDPEELMRPRGGKGKGGGKSEDEGKGKKGKGKGKGKETGKAKGKGKDTKGKGKGKGKGKTEEGKGKRKGKGKGKGKYDESEPKGKGKG
mmetsp:Transcript_39810/g.85187  ORF Transcript_39810/g.85187 Transcript_39810/m.85187 type:complete len:224 (-) Transcript_39810:35-706(-)